MVEVAEGYPWADGIDQSEASVFSAASMPRFALVIIRLAHRGRTVAFFNQG